MVLFNDSVLPKGGGLSRRLTYERQKKIQKFLCLQSRRYINCASVYLGVSRHSRYNVK